MAGKGSAWKGTRGPLGPGYAQAPHFSSQKGVFPANLQEKSNTAQAPLHSSSHCSNPQRSFYRATCGCAAQTLCTCPATPTRCTPQLPAWGASQIFPWFLSHLSFISQGSAQDVLLPHAWQPPHRPCIFCRCFRTERGYSCPLCNSRSETSREEHVPGCGWSHGMNSTVPSHHGSWSSLTDRDRSCISKPSDLSRFRVLAAEESLETSLACKARDQKAGEESGQS